MPRSPRSFLFPDVNVWIALTYAGHVHHKKAGAWFEAGAEDDRLCFCRFTQLSLLRLLTTRAVMGDDEVMNKAQAWQAYDRWMGDSRVLLLDEPANLEGRFRELSSRRRPDPKTWADAYLLAFASVAGLRLVTFDQGLEENTGGILVLKA
jgi:toxin-antitoxin system PIN domain toxin